MSLFIALHFFFLPVINHLTWQGNSTEKPAAATSEPILSQPLQSLSACNCTISQGGATYPINSLIGNESAVVFYDYGNPTGSNANTGLELYNGLIIFLYEDTNTGIISLFLIADHYTDSDGGTLSFEFNCAPAQSFISVQDDAGEFFGAPPLFTGNWSWSPCCTDGGVIENIGCTANMSLDLLVSSGIDSIVWLTGDISNPTQILLSLTGEAITINCGGSGVCCPVGFDTDAIIDDATCELSTDGSITVSPQDGVSPYTYVWSNGASTSTNSNLNPGNYSVTITDAQGCMEELTFNVDFTEDPPQVVATNLDVCSNNAEAEFDLTSIEHIVNAGTGEEVLWFENANMTNPILFPQTYTTSGTTVYAVVDNGACLSEVVPVVLTIYPIPPGNEASIDMCEELNGFATFDLTSVDASVSGGAGEVFWYLSFNQTGPIVDPEFFNSHSQIVYAFVYDGHCYSAPIPVELIVYELPEAVSAEAQLCSDGFDQAIFDLTLLEPEISFGNGTVEWFLEMDLLDEITTPAFFQTTTTVVYAVVSDGVCESHPVPVTLTVEPIPTGNSITIDACGEGSNTAIFALQDYDGQISGGAGSVDWFIDDELQDPINNPSGFVSESTTVYAVIDNGFCFSPPIPIVLNVLQSPNAESTNIETCAGAGGEGMFNLTSVENVISGGTGVVQWFEDIAGTIPIANTTAYQSTGGTVYAQVSIGNCISPLTPVQLILISSVTANPSSIATCDNGTGNGVFNLTTIESTISGGVGQVNWYLDAVGVNPVPSPDNYVSGPSTLYAQVVAGSCLSSIVPIDLQILPTPISNSTALSLCGNLSGETSIDLHTLDGLIGEGTGNVIFYADISLTTLIADANNLMTGDTVIFAVTDNGMCRSDAEAILITVTPQPVASSVIMMYCVTPGDEITIDLTQFNNDISGGLGTVYYFTDAQGMNIITMPTGFITDQSLTLYALTEVNNCQSTPVPLMIDIIAQPEINPVTISQCGDPSGQITVDLSVYESLISNNSGIVNWYSDAALTNPILNTQNFITGNTIVYTTVTNLICYTNAFAIPIEIVNSLSANTVNVELCVIDSDTPSVNLTLYEPDISGGNGSVTWFYDSQGLNQISTSTGFDASQNTIYAMVTAGSCVSPIIDIPIIYHNITSPNLTCEFTSGDSVAVAWTGNASSYEISYFVNGVAVGSGITTITPNFSLGNLERGDSVMFALSAIYDAPCDTVLENTVICVTQSCPPANVSILDPGLLCEDGMSVTLEAEVTGLSTTPVVTWSGAGVIDLNGIFDPGFANTINPLVTVNVSADGCDYSAELELIIIPEHEITFEITGSPCVDNILQLQYIGEAVNDAAIWTWSYDGAMADTIHGGDQPVLLDVYWTQPGTKNLSLVINDMGCEDQFELSIDIIPETGAVELSCVEETFSSVTVSFNLVTDAVAYNLTSNKGYGIHNGNTYIVTGLMDDTDVEIIIEALGAEGCGESRDTIVCHTPKFIKPEIYFPTIFSPNQDGINDIFFIQTNEKIKEIHLLRIFDRWGNLVFERKNALPNDVTAGWNGIWQNKPLNPGVYSCWAELLDTDGESIIHTGDITLIR